MGQQSAPQRICGADYFWQKPCQYWADCLTGQLPVPTVKRTSVSFWKRRGVTSACAAASPPSRPGCAERCSVVLQPDSLPPPETRMAGYTSAPTPSLLSASERPDLPLHGGNTDPLCKDHNWFLSIWLWGVRAYRLDVALARQSQSEMLLWWRWWKWKYTLLPSNQSKQQVIKI